MTWKPESHRDNHPRHSIEDWKNEVWECNTRQSYIEWVNSMIEQEPMLLISKACHKRVVGWLRVMQDQYIAEFQRDNHTELGELIAKLGMLESEEG